MLHVVYGRCVCVTKLDLLEYGFCAAEAHIPSILLQNSPQFLQYTIYIYTSSD